MVTYMYTQTLMHTCTHTVKNTHSHMKNVALIKEADSRMNLSFYLVFVIQFSKPETFTIMFDSHRGYGLEGGMPSETSR